MNNLQNDPSGTVCKEAQVSWNALSIEIFKLCSINGEIAFKQTKMHTPGIVLGDAKISWNIYKMVLCALLHALIWIYVTYNLPTTGLGNEIWIMQEE